MAALLFVVSERVLVVYVERVDFLLDFNEVNVFVQPRPYALSLENPFGARRAVYLGRDSIYEVLACDCQFAQAKDLINELLLINVLE